MRAVALADKDIQTVINESFIPLKIEMKKGEREFPLDWKALGRWRTNYAINLTGDEKQGFTMCAVVSPDLEMELGSTGSAFVWEMFTSIAYDKDKFLKMVKNAASLNRKRDQLLADIIAGTRGSRLNYTRWKMETNREIRAAGRISKPPEGFSKENALELFKMSGDLK